MKMKSVDQQKSENEMEKDAANRRSRWDIHCPNMLDNDLFRKNYPKQIRSARWDIHCPNMLNNDLKRKGLLKILESEKKKSMKIS